LVSKTSILTDVRQFKVSLRQPAIQPASPASAPMDSKNFSVADTAKVSILWLEKNTFQN